MHEEIITWQEAEMHEAPSRKLLVVYLPPTSIAVITEMHGFFSLGGSFSIKFIFTKQEY